MTPVEKAIRQLIALDGPQNLERVMGLSNAHYYATRDPFGKDGDFITSPEISQMFGEMIGLWLIAAWQAKNCPTPVRLIELGPGRGTLMSDAVRVIARLAPALLQALHIHLVEASPVLKEAQAQCLAALACPLSWHTHLDDIPDGFTLLVANEFFDALPIRQAIRSENGWNEKCVIIQDDKLVFSVSRSPLPDTAIPSDLASTQNGDYAEFSPASTLLAQSVAQRLHGHGGAALIIDYGHTQTRCGETLQALKNHKPHPVLEDMGEADLTAHVDFANLVRHAHACGCTTSGPVTQAHFLHAMGLPLRAEQLAAKATPEQKQAILAAATRLTDTTSPTSMGQLFKVLCIHDPAMPPLSGF